MIYPLVRELAETGPPIRVPVAVTCRVLKIAKEPFYRWLKAPVSTRDWDDAQLTNAAIDAHEEAPTFGYRLIADELTDLGFEVSERRVWRLCSPQGIVSATTRMKRGRAGKQGLAVAVALLRMELHAGDVPPADRCGEVDAVVRAQQHVALVLGLEVVAVHEVVSGKRLPHNAAQIAGLTRPIEGTELQPGDLVFFNSTRRAHSHMGIYMGDGRFIHAPSSRGRIRVERMDNNYFKPRLDGVRTLVVSR